MEKEQIEQLYKLATAILRCDVSWGDHGIHPALDPARRGFKVSLSRNRRPSAENAHLDKPFPTKTPMSSSLPNSRVECKRNSKDRDAHHMRCRKRRRSRNITSPWSRNPDISTKASARVCRPRGVLPRPVTDKFNRTSRRQSIHTYYRSGPSPWFPIS